MKIINKKGKILILIGVLLILISTTLFIGNKYEEIIAGKESQEILQDLNLNINNEENQDLETISINGYDYMGSIIIPSLNLELPIINDYDYSRLKKAPCRYYGSIDTNDLIICAHSYKTHFRYIGTLKQGEKIIIQDISGKKYVYEVLEIEILKPTDVDKMINNDFDLTLYTCTSDGLNRITVRSNRIGEIM